MKKTFFILFVSVFITSCSSLFHTTGSSLMKIHKGMTENEVASLMGSPSYRRFDEMVEQWEYRSYNVDGTKKVVIINFENGVVSGMDSFEHEEMEQPNVVEVPGHVSCIDNEFKQLYASVQKATFKSDKYEVLKLARHTKLTCKQCATIMMLFTFDDDRLDALAIMEPRLRDDNYDEILNKLSFISSEEKAKKILGLDKESVK